MDAINVREARERFSALLDRVEAGEEVVIQRRGKPVARLMRPESERHGFPSRAALRETLPPAREPATQAVRTVRDDERF